MQECLDKIINALQEFKATLPTEVVEKKTIPAATPEEPSNFQDLVNLLNSDKWPEAVNSYLVCDPNILDEKIARGNGIFDLMVEQDIANIKFLDFGCGEGWSVKRAADKNASLAVGYDIKSFETWDEKENVHFSTNWEEIEKHAPYDVILCFDVLDHVKNMEPVECLKKMKSVLKDDGKIYARMHPGTSRHANHFYHVSNKAFLNLVFTDEELKQMFPEWGDDSSYKWEHNIGLTRPLASYGQWLNEANLVADQTREIKDDVEEFFSQTPSIAKRVMKNTNFDVFPTFQMSLSFVDSILKKK